MKPSNLEAEEATDLFNRFRFSEIRRDAVFHSHIRHQHPFAVKVILGQHDIAAESRLKQAEAMETNAELSLATKLVRVCSKLRILRRNGNPYQNAVAFEDYILTKEPREFAT